MPLYEYQCKHCGRVTEDVFSVRDFPAVIQCECGSMASKIISLCAVHGDEPTWIDDSLRGALCGPYDKPINTRTDLKTYLRDNPDIQPCG